MASRRNEEAAECLKKLESSDYAKNIKQQIEEAKAALSAVSTSAIIMVANPFHRAHERLVRITLEKNDLVVIFLLDSHEREELLPFALRKKTLQYFVENYLHKNRVLVIPLNSEYIGADCADAANHGVVAKSLGCDTLVVGEHHNGIGFYYDNNHLRTSLDGYEGLARIEVVSRFVFCNECNTLVSTRTCPHGMHHHIKYNSSSLVALLKEGILPPAVLMRKDISAIILSSIYPNRFKNIAQIYNDLFPGTGLIETHSDEDFYMELMKLYQTTSLT
ncbi:MAG: sulfate adenylyltransferase [Campylobacteraceae bacterium]|jgi:sulfate adenylyltransferase|nr:sulfate adenylyltransferase [Campylobacteraceae bacterium]